MSKYEEQNRGISREAKTERGTGETMDIPNSRLYHKAINSSWERCNQLSKMTYFVVTTERMLVERLARLFRDNVWKLHRLPESMVLDRGLQFIVELTKELNRMLEIEMRLSIAFHPQTDRQTEQMNQELEQYLWFFVNHRQKDWPEQLALAEFVVNNKVYSATKIFPFIANYGRELKMGRNIRKKGKVEKAMEFLERMKKVQKEAGAVLKKTQEDMKRQVDRGRKEIEEWKKGDSDVEHKGLGVQRITGQKTSELICRSIYNRESNIYQYSQITIVNLDENSSSCECQSDSTIQGTDKRTEKRGEKASGNRRS